MNSRSHVALVAALAAVPVMAQDVNVTSTTVLQSWKESPPGFEKEQMTPVTELLRLDATKLGTERLSLHLYGWGQRDLSAPSGFENPRTGGHLSYAYLDYHFDQANAEIKAGRFSVNQGGAYEMVDGVFARADLKGGFALSAFGGVPVLFRPLDPVRATDYAFQRDLIFGTRLSLRLPRMGEVGVSFLEDGTQAAKNLDIPSPYDYTRRQAGVDLSLAPFSFADVTGRTLFDLADHPALAPGVQERKIAEHDYHMALKPMETVVFTAGWTERNYRAYYAGTTLPSLFDQDEKGLFRATEAKVLWTALPSLQVAADWRRTNRDTYGTTNRAGLDARYTFGERKVMAGFAYHKVNAHDVQVVDALHPVNSYDHSETRAWVMANRGKAFGSLDVIRVHYQGDHASLNGKRYEIEGVASAGWHATETLQVSADLAYGATPFSRKETTGLLKVEYRFGLSRKGGSK